MIKKYKRTKNNNYYQNKINPNYNDIKYLPTINENNEIIDHIHININKNIPYSIHNNQNIIPLNNDLLFHNITNHFRHKILEKLYQSHSQDRWFHKSRDIFRVILIIHITLSIIFAILENNENDGFDLLPRTYKNIGEYCQWIYLLLALPYVFLSKNRITFFKIYWKIYIPIIIILFITGLEIWIAYQAQISSYYYEKLVLNSLNCTYNKSNNISKRIEYFGTKNINHFLIYRNIRLYASFIGISLTLLTILGCTLAVATRLDFPQVFVVFILLIITLFITLKLYKIKQDISMICGYVFPGILLCISSYSFDRTLRQSFLANQIVEKENLTLKSTLEKAEEALMNDSARLVEKKAVNDVFSNNNTNNDTNDYDKNNIYNLNTTTISNNNNNNNGSNLDHVRIPFDDIKLIKVIGRGGMGEVIKAQYLGTTVVCKRMLREKISLNSIKIFRAEVELMSNLRHPNIVQFIGASWDNCSNICMVLEYLENGDLHTVVHLTSIGKKFTWCDPLLKMAIDAGQGILYLHSQNPPIVHRDLKSVNLLCSATYGCKISDFGLSKRQKRTIYNDGSYDRNNGYDALSTIVGTPFWLAPELIRNEKYDRKVDVYSFGIVLTELETKQMPYHDLNETGLKVMMRVAKYGLRPTLDCTCLPQIRRLISDCLQDDPKKRPDFVEILHRLQGEIRMAIIENTEKEALQRRALLKQYHNKRNNCIPEGLMDTTNTTNNQMIDISNYENNGKYDIQLNEINI